MKAKLFLFSTLAINLLLLFACSQVPKQLNVNESHAGKEVKISNGGIITVTLETTSCFEWELANISDKTVLLALDYRFDLPEIDKTETTYISPFCGPMGEAIWIFQAIGKGRSTINLECNQTVEGGLHAIKTFDVTVIVK